MLLLEGPVGALLGRHDAAALGVPRAGVMFQPASPTGEFSPPALGVRSYRRLGNRFVWWASGFAERVYAPVIAELRRDLGLLAKPSHAERTRDWPVLYPFSEHVLPRQPEAASRLLQPFFITVSLVEAAYFINLAFMALFVFATPVYAG